METLNVTLSDSQDLSLTEEIETINMEVAPAECNWTPKTFKAYKAKLAYLSKIHNEVASKINANRQAIHTAFFRPEDAYIPEPSKNNLYDLWIDTLSQANPMPILP